MTRLFLLISGIALVCLGIYLAFFCVAWMSPAAIDAMMASGGTWRMLIGLVLITGAVYVATVGIRSRSILVLGGTIIFAFFEASKGVPLIQSGNSFTSLSPDGNPVVGLGILSLLLIASGVLMVGFDGRRAFFTTKRVIA